jgi:hypothetical protein
MEKPKATDAIVPYELSMYTPRAVRLNVHGRIVAAIAAMLAIAGLVGPALLWADRERKAVLREHIERSGVAAEAEITRTGKTRGDHPQRFADYLYAGDLRGRVVFSDRDRRRALAPGQKIDVRYLPAEPRRSWAVGYEPHGAPLAALAALPAALWFAAAAIVVSLRRQWRLLAEGRAATGRVLEVKRAHTKSHDHARYRAEYEVTLLSGASRRAWAPADARTAEGSVVPVVYDPERPRRLARYPLPLVRVILPGE